MSGGGRRGVAIWLVTSVFLIYQNLLNTLFGLVSLGIGVELKVNAVQIGLLAAAFVYAYGAMQVPVGVLFDRLDPRRLLTAATLACAAGALLFAQTDGFAGGVAGRTLMGLGGALAYVGASTLMAVWYPSRLAMMIGLTQFIDALGSAAGQPILAALSESWSWRELHLGGAVTGMMLALLMWLIVRRPADFEQNAERRPLWPAVRQIVARPLTWLAAVYAAGTIGTIFSYGIVWNIALQRAFGSDLHAAAAVNGWLFVGFGAGAAILGWLAGHGLSRRLLLVLSPLASAMLIGLLVFLPPLSSAVLVASATALAGFGCGASVVVFEIVALAERPALRGTAIGLVNAVAFFAAAALQALHGLTADDSLEAARGILWIYPAVLIIAALSGFVLAGREQRA